MVKRTAALFCVIVLMFSLSGCGLIAKNADDLLSPPRAAGEYGVINDALKNSVTGEYTLKYPTDGDYRSAIIVQDLDDDGKNEAVAFYSTLTDKTVTVHINLIVNIGGEYVSVGDSKVTANDIECVEFCDMNADGKKEILVGYNVYGNVDKQVGVYEFTNNMLVQRALEKYTRFITCDLDGDSVNGLFIALLDTAQKTAAAKLFNIGDDGIAEKGVCTMDGNITSYSKPVITKLPTGKQAILIDAVKGSGMITEVLYYEENTLRNPFYDAEKQETSTTFRQSMVASRDINGDGIVEIPMLSPLPTALNIADTADVALTKWCVLSNDMLIVVRTLLMNYTDGYVIDTLSSWGNNFCVMRKTESRLRTVYTYDTESLNAVFELFSIVTVAEKTWDTVEYDRDGFTELKRANGLVYAYKISDYTGPEAVTPEILSSIFSLIEEEK